MSNPYGAESLSDDDDGTIDITELPNEYKIKLNGFLRSACQDGHETLTRVLLDKGADVNYVAPTAFAPTALHVAILQGKDKIVPILLPQANEATVQSALKFALEYQTKLANIIRALQKDALSTTTTTTSTGAAGQQRESEILSHPKPTTETETQTPPASVDLPSSSSPPDATTTTTTTTTASISNDDEATPLSPPADLPKPEVVESLVNTKSEKEEELLKKEEC